MSFLVGSVKSQASQQAAVSGLQLQSSAYGKALALVYGTTRIAPNLIWYGDFVGTPKNAQPSGGGKGGAVGGGNSGKGGSNTGSYQYQTAVALGICEGQIQGVGRVFVDKSITDIASLGLSLFKGSYGQSAWGYLTSKHPNQAIGYSGVAYLAANSYQLGTNPQLPNHNFEIYGIFSNSLQSIGVLDADPSLVVADLLTNVNYGAGFPSSRLANLSVYQSYCIASGMWISPAYTTQTQSSSILDDIAKATNSAFVWSQGVLNLIPYGDQNISAHGYSYTAPSVPLYDLGDDDFMSGKNGGDIIITRKRPSDSLNSISLECLDRTNSYNTAIIEAQNQAMIDVYGLRKSTSQQMHLFADTAAARTSVQLQLQRQAINNIYQFTLDQRYVLLDPMDIVTITNSVLGLNKQWVRILEITENNDSTLDLVAEEYLAGTGHTPSYNYQLAQGFSADYNSSAAVANSPIIFEPTAQLSENLEIWLAVSGGGNWGGSDIYISGDGNSYKNVGRITGSARMGVLTSALPSVNVNALGQTIDANNILSVDLSDSAGQLLSGSQSDAINLATICYVDGEYIAYQNAILTDVNKYNLNWLIRGAYGSSPATHNLGSQFVRLDSGIFKYSFTPDYIGSTIYIKLVSFNIYGGGQQAIADVLPYSYKIQGTAYSSALPDIENLRTNYVASITQLSWDEIVDFRPVLYEIRKGAAWSGSQILARIAHPPFTVQGNDTYWVSAYSQPVAGLQVYSENAVSISVQGAQIVSNVIASYDESATGWSGSFSGTAVVVGSSVVTSGANILTVADYLGTPSIIYYGFQGNGIYEIPTSHQIDIGRAVACGINIDWVSFGQHIYDNILSINDFLGSSDVLDYAASVSVNVYPEIALSQDGVTWGAWQKYDAGSYLARKFKARIQLQTLDPTVEAFLSDFTFAVDVPDRDDHIVNLSVPSGGTTVTFQPDGALTAAAFNGGTQGSPTLPHIQVTILNAQNGDVAVISSISLSSCFVQVLNAGIGVARSVNLLVQGY